MHRSMLFLPGNAPNMLINGDALGADCVIFDLEDAVSPAEKDAARILIRNVIKALRFEGCDVAIRVNASDTPLCLPDLEEMVPLLPSYIMPPKINGAEDIVRLDEWITDIEHAHRMQTGIVRLIPLLETALGVENAYAVATASPRVAALFLGAEDLTADLQSRRTREGAEIAYARSRVVMAARAAGIAAYDTPFTDVNDDEGALADAVLAKELGFTGKAAISPRHVAFINEAFTPSRAEVEYAREVLDAIEEAEKQGRGVIAVRGKMVDAPIVRRAKQILEASGR